LRVGRGRGGLSGATVTLHDLTFCDIERRLEADGVSRAHALPLFQALHQGLETRPEEVGGFAPPLRRWLERWPGATVEEPGTVSVAASEDGWTRKFLFGLSDGARIESVLMGFPGRFTACLSSQVGCAMGCVFCATGKMGFVRNLTAGEMVAQAHAIERFVRGLPSKGGGVHRVRNLVLMGMGEPLHNFEETMQALEILTDTRGLNIGPARVTVSTVGHVPGIRKLARHPKRYSLAVSLHGASDEERAALVPANRKWPLAELLEACREYTAVKNERVFVAWTMIGDVNDGVGHARRLAALLRGMDVHVNLIPLNPVGGFGGRAPEPERVIAFQKVLQDAGLPSTVRQRRGLDVAAGCGQLAAEGRRD